MCYNNNINIIARLTTDFIKDKEIITFDFKNIGERNKNLKVATESLPLNVLPKDKECILSMLRVLEFYEAANNLRTMYVYKKDNVKFEIDDYTRPVMKVVGIEGKKEEVEQVYKHVLSKNNLVN